MSKPKQILKLEKQLGLTLPELKKGSVLDNRNHYQCNEKGEVTGIVHLSVSRFEYIFQGTGRGGRRPTKPVP